MTLHSQVNFELLKNFQKNYFHSSPLKYHYILCWNKLNQEIDSKELSSQDVSYEDFDFSSKKNETENFEYPVAIQENVVIEESLSLEEREKELIIKALNKHNGRRKNAALELGISERTLYRKIKEYEIQK